MTPERVATRVKEIEAAGNDMEGVHIDQDRLWVDVLTSIADGTCTDAAACAREALKAGEILGGERWFA